MASGTEGGWARRILEVIYVLFAVIKVVIMHFFFVKRHSIVTFDVLVFLFLLLFSVLKVVGGYDLDRYAVNQPRIGGLSCREQKRK